MNYRRRAHSTIYHNSIFSINNFKIIFIDFIYVFGGINTKMCLKNCERYNLTTNTWEEIE